MNNPARYRAIFLSDTHLGTRGCKVEYLLDFLRHHESEYLYLVGDIVDGWRLRRAWHWDQSHNDVVQKLLRKARKGTRVIYIPGNHDEFAPDYTDMLFGGISVVTDAIHTTADGQRLLVLHGDEFDGVVKYAPWLAVPGDWAYRTMLWVNHWFNMYRRRFGYPYWSLSAWLKHEVKNAVQFIGEFEKVVAEEAKRRGVDGVVCGHIHRPEIRDINGLLYCNDGDWVENCSALVEHQDGRLEIVHWTYLHGNAVTLLAVDGGAMSGDAAGYPDTTVPARASRKAGGI
jgi:UDP-2,3-diacylglucosamine pyrophosphatase LpxH